MSKKTKTRARDKRKKDKSALPVLDVRYRRGPAEGKNIQIADEGEQVVGNQPGNKTLSIDNRLQKRKNNQRK